MMAQEYIVDKTNDFSRHNNECKLNDTDKSEQIIISIETSKHKIHRSQSPLLEKMVIWIDCSLFEQLQIDLEKSENNHSRIAFDGQGHWRSMELDVETAAQ